MKYLSRLRKLRFPKLTRNQWLSYGGTLCAIIFVVVVIRTHSPRPGTTAFSVYNVALTDYQGKTVNFDSFKQRPLIVFFWASWCPYCNAELTHLGELKTQYGDQIQILAVNRGESLSDAKTYSDKLSLPKGIFFLLDPNDGLFKHLKGYAVPETIFVNGRGEEVVHKHGPMKPEEADQAAKEIL
jgi:thiol-disulfide isomerase/thioredoxin